MATERRFNPYSENGGTILAIAGQNFSVIAGDTRQSEGYSIQTRFAQKVFPLCVASTPLSYSSISFPTFAASDAEEPPDFDDARPWFVTRCVPLRVILVSSVLTSMYRTDKAVLAVNGFAADGKVFVKRVQQRLEARVYLVVFMSLQLILFDFTVVQARA